MRHQQPAHSRPRPLPTADRPVSPEGLDLARDTFECQLPDGTLTYCDTGGDKPVLLLLHGAYLSHQAWLPQIVELRQHFRVIAPDLRAHGTSTRAGKPYSVAMFAHDIQHLLVTLSLGPVYLCGHSLGGMVALALTLNAPASVHTLVLAETSYGTSSNRLEAFMTRWTRPMFSMFSVRWQAGLFARSLAKRNPRLQRYINREVLDYVQDSSTYLAIWDAVIAFDFASSLSKLQVPSLVIAGAQNKKTHAQARTFVQALPDAELIMIPEAGHLVNLDQPDAFNSALIAFFQTKVAPLERDGAIR